MEKRESIYSHEKYWESYHTEVEEPSEEKQLASYKYDTKIKYWLDYYEDRIGFALKEVELQLKHAQERKGEQEFELKLYVIIALVIVVLLPIALVMPLTGVFPLMVLGGILIVAELFGITIVIPICVYKIVKGIVSKVINDKDNMFGDWIVQRYHVPRLTGEIQACQIYVGRYKEQLTNIKEWREMLERGSFDIEESELRNKLEQVNLDPKIEIALQWNYKLKKLISSTTIVIVAIIYALALCLAVKGYISFYNWFLEAWRSV